jgi:hypothetical protein
MDAWNWVEKEFFALFQTLLMFRGNPLHTIQSSAQREYPRLHQLECHAIFHSVRGIKEQREMTIAVASVMLASDEPRLIALIKLMDRLATLSEARNKIVHGRWRTVGRDKGGMQYAIDGIKTSDPKAKTFRVLATGDLMEDMKTLWASYPKAQTTKYQKRRDRLIYSETKLREFRELCITLAVDLRLFEHNDLLGGTLTESQARAQLLTQQ